MARPQQFRTKRAYESRMGSKANKNLEIMAVVGDGDTVTPEHQVPGRDSFYWIRLVGDDDRLTQCFCDVCALSYGDLIYVARAKDEKLSYYEFVRFIQNADGDTTDPPVCPKFAQVVYVSENSCQFNTVGAAVVYINALVTGPAAGRLFLIKCQAGNFAEAGNVTIPQYVHLEGVGEASELEMGANSLLLSDDTSVLNIVVESSNASYAIGIVAKGNVILRNVHAIQTGAGTPDCFHVSAGSTNVHLYDCVAEIPANGVGFHVLGASNATLHTCTTLASACDATTYGFQMGDTATAVLDYCIADNDTYFNDALHLDNTALTCITRWCTFRGHDNDVNVAGTSPTWYHLACHFDPDNSTVAAGTHHALPTKRFNQTVIVAEEGGDFQILSEAIAWINAQGDAAANKQYGILMLTGNFAEVGNVTIPQYVHVAGMGEGSRLEMGANDVQMFSSHCSLLDLVIITTGSYGVNITGNLDVTLRNVRVEATGGIAGFRTGGNSNAKLYDCVVQATAAAANLRGFLTVQTAATVLLDHCIAEAWGANTKGLEVYGPTIARYCRFWSSNLDVLTHAGVTWEHLACHFDPDNSTIAAGTHTALPTKRFNQTVVVAEEGGDFQALSEALSWINAQGDAAAGKRYGVLMLAGNFAETGNVTIPRWVTVAGMGDGTRIEMGAFSLLMSDDSYLQDVTVTGTDTAITINDADCELFNVRVVVDGNYCVYISGDSDCELRHVVAKTTSGCNYGFFVTNTANVHMYDCEADDPANFTLAALGMADASCFCTTKHCTFRGDADDVWIGGAATWDSYKDQLDPGNCTLNSSTTDMLDTNLGNSFAFIVKNTSGGAVAHGDLGYVDEAGEFKTTATAYSNVSWAVAVLGGPNNADVWVARRGRVTVALNGNCAAGDYLYTSTTAGQAQPLSYVRPEVCAVALTANAVGAGGTCEALLLCDRPSLPLVSTNDILYIQAAAASDWQSTCNGAPVGAVVTYNVPLVSGAENAIVPVAAAELGKLVLHNTTRGEEAYIQSVNTGANTITVTAAADVAAWQNGDAITCRSQTNLNVPWVNIRYFEVYLASTEIPALAVGFEAWIYWLDSAANMGHRQHQFSAYSASYVSDVVTEVANVPFEVVLPVMPIINRKYTIAWQANGAASSWQIHRLKKVIVAAP